MANVYVLYKYTNELAVIEYQRHQMILKADELRQSSDDLTRMARTYVITKDKKYKDAYFKILAIRNGKSKRPKEYEGIYWDLSKELREKKHPDTKAITVEDEMKELPFSIYELEQLYKAKQNSDKLAKLEIKAFEILENNKDAQNEAIELLHSKQYHQAKEQIMLPIDNFLQSIRSRTQAQVDALNQKIENTFKILFVIFTLAIIVLIFNRYLVKNKILIPIEYLYNVIISFRKNNKKIEKKRFYNDEIGMLIEEFFIMKEKLQEEKQELQKMAEKDPLTNIYNRRAFFEMGTSFFKHAKRDNTPLCIIMVDIDFFKKINDTYGHQTGDMILKHLSKNVKQVLRENDLFARYGGEEFIILLQKTDLEKARIVAEKIRSKIEKTPYKDEENEIYITVSLGIAQVDEKDSSLNETISKADTALYKAKENGRNQVSSV
jgi:diguanylate cyclase (GGDEF)-like protein